MNRKTLISMFCIVLIILTPFAFADEVNNEVPGPLLDITLPEYIDSARIDILGKTDSNTTVELWINTDLVRKADLEKGDINFMGVEINANEENIIIIKAINEKGINEKQFIIFSDLTVPGINLSVSVPEITSKKILILRGTVSEITDIEIFLNEKSISSQENTRIFFKNISLQEGENNISITAADKAGNIGKLGKSIFLDTSAPQITDIKPRRDAFYYEGRAVDNVEGRTEPFAKVTLYYEYEAVAKEEKKRQKIAETKADKNGYFKFKRIDFEHPAPGITIRETRPGEYVPPAHEKRDINSVEFIIAAEDSVGLKAEEILRISIGTCWSGWPIFDMQVLPEYQRPSLMSPERLAEGTEIMSFILNISYGGSANDWKITDINVDDACGRSAGKLAEEYKGDLRYEVACGLLQRARPIYDHNRKKTLWYIEYRHLKTEQLTNFTEDFWKEFPEHEITFPLKIRVGFQEKELVTKPDGTSAYTWSSTKYQVKCIAISYFIDVPVDPRKVLPDWLVEGGIDFANKSVQKLDEILPMLEDARDVVGAACIGSFIVRWIIRIYRMGICKWESTMGKLVKKDGENGLEACPPTEAETEDEGSRLSLNTEQLQAKCPKCANAWNMEANLYKAYRWTCDRIFCHVAPASWTEKATDVEVFKAEQRARVCGGDEIAGVQSLNQVKNCYKAYEDKLEKTYVDNKQKICYMYGNALYVYDGFASESPQTVDGKEIKIYKLILASKKPGIIGEKTPPELIKVVKSGNKYATATAYTCEELCKMTYHTNVTADCINAKECTKKGGKEGHIAGYSQKDCWFENSPAPFDLNMQCCCFVEEKEPEEKGTALGWEYREQQLNRETDGDYGTKYRTDKYISGRDLPACFGQDHLFDYLRSSSDKIVPMMDPFSQHTTTFQCLCITGIIGRLRLLKSILSGMANCLQQIKTTGKADAGVCKELFTQYICDLLYQLFVRIQQGCIPLPFGQKIDLGGGASTGSVEESIEAPSIGSAFRIGLESIGQATAKTAEDLVDEYGETTLSNFLAGGEKEISRKLCLAAFGFDVGLDFKSLMDMSYQTQFKTSVGAFATRRDFLTYNPATGIPTYEYRTAWTIYPGCDIRDYSIDLTCINLEEQAKYLGIDCSAVTDLQHGDAPKGCNCLYSDKSYAERSRKFYISPAGVDAGIFEDKDNHIIIDDSMIRYDHLKFKINLEKGFDADKCFPEGHKDGIFYFPITDKTATDLLDCFVDQKGKFRCTKGIEWEKQGEAWFVPFSLEQCGYDRECYLLCQNPRNTSDWRDCAAMAYGLRDDIKVKFRVQGTKPQCINAYMQNQAGKKITDPSTEYQRVGQETIEGHYTTTKVFKKLGTVSEANLGVTADYVFGMPNGTCEYKHFPELDKKPYNVGEYKLNFEKGNGGYKIETASDVYLPENKSFSKDTPYPLSVITRMKFVIGGFGIRIDTIPGAGDNCTFKVTQYAAQQIWKIHAELRYPDFSGQCTPSATEEIAVVAELTEIDQNINVQSTKIMKRAPKKTPTEEKVNILDKKITVSFNNTLLENAFNFLEDITGADFVYEEILGLKQLKIAVENITLAEFLAKIGADYEVLTTGKVYIKSINECLANGGTCRDNCITDKEIEYAAYTSACNGLKCCIPS